jgi:CheY-like chemotaxis protein
MSDEGAERELLKAVLMRHGARVTAAYSMAEALALLKRKRPDVFVADFEMAGHNGTGLLEAVRGEGNSSIPTLAIVNETPSGSDESTLLAQFQRYMTRPLDPIQLADSIRALATGTRQKRKLPRTPLS